MTTHPAPDPFLFDSVRIQWSADYDDDQLAKKGVYQTPAGPITVLDEDERSVAIKIFYRFNRLVAGLSAHQRMAWAAAAQAEGVAP